MFDVEKSLTKSLASEGINQGNEALDWYLERCNAMYVDIRLKDLTKLTSWNYDDKEIVHKNRAFFTIKGISVENDFLKKESWCQPIIDQPEIGYLGFLCAHIEGVLHFLFQAKIEPGNINSVQLSPTIQATNSNFTAKHGGRKPYYLELFASSENVLTDALLSEQGGRFLKKRNRNMVIYIDDYREVELHSNYRWMTLKSIYSMIRMDNIVNMDTRTVLSTLPLYRPNLLCERIDSRIINNSQALQSWLISFKFCHTSNFSFINLSDMDSWLSNNKLIGHEEKKFFEVIGVEIDVESREVESWDQPMIRPIGIGMCGLIFSKIADEVFCLIQVKYECGYIDMFELAPTIQFLNGRLTSLSESDSYLYQKFTTQNKPMHFSHQSEEGGRFFHEENACKIIEVQNIDEIDLPSTHKWVPLRILQQKIAQSAHINIQLRTLVFILSMELSF